MKKADKKFGSKGSLYRVLLLVTYGAMLLGQFGRIELVTGVSVYLHELVLFWLLVIWLIDKEKVRVDKKTAKLYGAGGLFLGVAWLSLVVNLGFLGAGLMGSSLYLVRLMLYAGLWPMLADIKKRNILTWSIRDILIVVGVILGLTGLVQYVLIPDTTNLVLYGWDDHLYRAVGILFDPNFLGLVIVLTLVLLMFKKPLNFRLLILMLVTLGLTYSRSAYLALVSSIVAISYYRKSISMLLAGGVIVLVGLWLLPNRGGEGNNLIRIFSIQQRLESQRAAVEIWKSKPVLGVGFNAYKLYIGYENKYEYLPYRVSGPDNSFLLILSTTGIVGTLVFGNLVVELLRAHGSKRWLGVSLLVVAVHSMFNNSLFYPLVMVWVFSLLAEAGVTGNT